MIYQLVPAGLYIHVPFCVQFCTYCDFYSVRISPEGSSRVTRERLDNYVEALSKEIRLRSFDFNIKSFVANTIYFGGGTPSVLSSAHLEKVLKTISCYYPISANPEITIEVNPDDVTEDYSSRLYDMSPLSVNRISLGVQSFVDDHLKWMNRRHDSAKAVEAFYTLRNAGFKNISIDLIFGFEGLSIKQWKSNIKKAISLMPEHISCYQMGIEKGTKLHKSYLSGDYTIVSDEVSYQQYSMLQQMLGDAGYVQYEISSFCLPGKRSRHNSSYWDFTPYFGFGPAAHSFDGVTREWNKKGINRYVKSYGLDENVSPLLKRREILSKKDISHEFIMLSLRTVKGIDLELASHYIVDIDSFMKKAYELIARGDLIKTDDYLRIPSDKLFISDSIIREFF